MRLAECSKRWRSAGFSGWSLMGVLLCGSLLGCQTIGGQGRKEYGSLSPASTEMMLNPLSATAIDQNHLLLAHEANVEPILVDLNHCLLSGLRAYKHEFGAHTVLGPELASGRIKILVPPGLNRGQQIQFHREVQGYVLNVHNAYRNFIAAYRQASLQAQEEELRRSLFEAIRSQVEAQQATLTQQREVALAEIDFELKSLAGFRDDGTLPTVEVASLRLVALCQLPGPAALYAPTGISTQNLNLLASPADVELTLRMHPEIVERRYQWYSLQRRSPTRDNDVPAGWCQRVVTKTPPTAVQLPNTAFALLAAEERRVRQETMELRQQIIAVQRGMELNERQLDLLREQLSEAELAVEKKQLSRDQLLRAKLQVVSAQQLGVRLELQRSMLFDRYWHHCGLLCELAGIEFPDYWLSSASWETRCACWQMTGPSASGQRLEGSELLDSTVPEMEDAVGGLHSSQAVSHHHQGASIGAQAIQDPHLLPDIQAGKDLVNDDQAGVSQQRPSQ